MSRDRRAAPRQAPAARERILDAAYELFSKRGVRDVGVEEILARAGIAKATLYRYFPSKNELVLAFLRRRQQRWTHEWLQAHAARAANTPQEQLLAMFDLLDGWFHRRDFEGCSFINVMLEMGNTHPAGRASIQHLENIRTILRDLATQAELRAPDAFARSWHILMQGAIVAAAEGDKNAARRAKAIGQLLLDQHRPDP